MSRVYKRYEILDSMIPDGKLVLIERCLMTEKQELGGIVHANKPGSFTPNISISVQDIPEVYLIDMDNII